MYLSKLTIKELKKCMKAICPELVYSGKYHSKTSRSEYYFFDFFETRSCETIVIHDFEVRISDHKHKGAYRGSWLCQTLRLGQNWKSAKQYLYNRKKDIYNLLREQEES